MKQYALRLLILWIIGICCGQMGFAGCRAKPAAIVLSEYTSLLRARTKKTGMYKGLDTALLVSATYRDWSLQQAYTKKYAADHKLTPTEQQKLVEEQKVKQAEGYEFIVATAFTNNDQLNELDKKDSIWSVYLINNEGLRVKPIYIKRQKPVSIYIAEYYPYFSPWKKVYKILFPPSPADQSTPLITEHTKQITLELTSAMGKLALDWDL